MQALLTRVVKGAAAGIVATAAMSAVMLGARRLGLLGEPPPRRLTRRVLSPLGLLGPRGRALDVTALAAHFAYGAALGGVFALPPGRSTRARGLLYGAGVWAANYAVALPALGLMPPARRDRPGRPTSMIAAHLVYGAALAATYRRIASDSLPLRGKVVVVCGGSRGLGRALSRALGEEGARVAICGRSAESLQQTRIWLASFGIHVLTEVCDLRDEAQTAAFLARVTEELGAVDVLIANAATIEVGPIESLKPADFDAAMSEIFGSALRATLAVLPQMRARGRGTIAFITSIGGKLGVPHLAPYSAAKFAEVGFAEALSAEVAKDGVHVLTAMPGLMRTGSHLHAHFRGEPERELAWFGASAITPLLSIDADRAARHVVRAIARRDRFVTFTPAAHLGAFLHDAAPELWSLLAKLAGRLLPQAPAGSAAAASQEGVELMRRSTSTIVDLIMKHSARLAQRHNQ
jgi:NAD(P)-dependent dehydrogenase (short-subunit alcohol dehydrogenase family)